MGKQSLLQVGYWLVHLFCIGVKLKKLNLEKRACLRECFLSHNCRTLDHIVKLVGNGFRTDTGKLLVIQIGLWNSLPEDTAMTTPPSAVDYTSPEMKTIKEDVLECCPDGNGGSS